jgi:hypothetical protein
LTLITALVGVGAWYFSLKLGAAKDAALNQFKAASAATVAAADARAAEANEKAAEASRGAAKALVDAASASARAGAVELEAAQQRERAAKAERELTELRHRIAPRRLSAEQRASIVASIRSTPAQIGIVRLGDAEAGVFADDLVAALREAGWTVQVAFVGMTAPPRYGLSVHAQSATAIPPAVSGLVAALKRLGLPVVVSPERLGPNMEEGLFVGLKPVAP